MFMNFGQVTFSNNQVSFINNWVSFNQVTFNNNRVTCQFLLQLA